MTAQPVGAPRQGHTNEEPAWHVLDEPAFVRFLPSGTPLALRWRGSIWQVIGEPVSWSSSSSWWEPRTPALDSSLGSPVGGQGSLVTTRFWRFQAQTGPASPVLEFDMSTDPRWKDWRLRRVAGVDGF
ncbi:DUF6504 family protein [Arthrobacter cheniae]|uniref:DUF6504 family protein n=1 Tax=Arthrobacter cheniae TaxID=1258888 RepID=UPI0011C3F201|nr:DUF6504 family protein [Arthrobacter cheniae]